MDPVKLINIKQMAEILQVSVNWLYQRTRLGAEAIPFVKVGKHLRFNPEEVIAFLRNREEKVTSP